MPDEVTHTLERVAAALPGGGESRPGQVEMAEAVAAAVAVTPSGGVVLFSPSAPTPGPDAGYRERSREFVSAAGLGETAGSQ